MTVDEWLIALRSGRKGKQDGNVANTYYYNPLIKRFIRLTINNNRHPLTEDQLRFGVRDIHEFWLLDLPKPNLKEIYENN